MNYHSLRKLLNDFINLSTASIYGGNIIHCGNIMNWHRLQKR